MFTQTPQKISVLIVDDHPPLRAGVRTMLEKTPDIFVVGEAGSGDEAEKSLAELRPNIILLDLKMPDFSPAAFEKWARENYPEYSWTIDWCFNGTTITSTSQYPTVWATYYWRFVRHTANTPANPSGGVGKTSYSHYAQSEFCFFQTYRCLSYSYPWVNQSVRGNGTYSGSAGGD